MAWLSVSGSPQGGGVALKHKVPLGGGHGIRQAWYKWVLQWNMGTAWAREEKVEVERS